jgi:hypothetical protein
MISWIARLFALLPVAPLSSVTVSVAVKVATLLKACVTTLPVVVVPSPKSQL